VNRIHRLRSLIAQLNNARRQRDAIREEQCGLRCGLEPDMVRALRTAGMSRADLAEGSLPMTAERAVALAVLDREMQRVELEMDGIEFKILRCGREIEAENGTSPMGDLTQSAVVIPFPAFQPTRRAAVPAARRTASVA
jgi:hypothetical protein